jgi:sec-independent protein translocase protein TatA
MSGPEIFVIIIVALLLFGAEKLPEIAKTIGKGMRDFKKATDDIRQEIETSTSDFRRDLTDVSDTIKKDVTNYSEKIKGDMNDVSESIKNDMNNVTSEARQSMNEMKDSIHNDANEIRDNIQNMNAAPKEPVSYTADTDNVKKEAEAPKENTAAESTDISGAFYKEVKD